MKNAVKQFYKCSLVDKLTLAFPFCLFCQESSVDLPPHIYALTDNMYRNMMIERESQCVIIR